jgi:hypothetical protein
MSETNILARISGEYIGSAARGLSDAETASEEIQEAIIHVPSEGAVRITFKRLVHKRGRSSHFFWTAEKAERVVPRLDER